MSVKKALESEFEKTLPDRLGKVADLFKKNNIDPQDVGAIKAVKLSEWQMGSKDDDGNPQVTDLGRVSFIFEPKWADGPEWPVVQRAAPTTVKPTTSKRKTLAGWKTAVILPDPQIGFRRYEDGTFDPFHDDKAIRVAMQIVRHLRPDMVVNLGDMLDFAEWGKFEQEPAFQMTTQSTLDRAHLYLAEQRANAPEADISVIEGNHDRRLQKGIIKNAMSAFGLRQADTPPDSWPVLSLPHLLRLDELDVEYVQGYPAGEKWINDNLVCIHGAKVRSNGSTASAVIDDERVSVIFGHVHRIELQHKTRRVRDGSKQSFAATPGCLARRDGSVPSTKSSTDCYGRPVAAWENWQQGVAVVKYQEGDGRFDLDMIPIYEENDERWAIYEGKEFSSV